MLNSSSLQIQNMDCIQLFRLQLVLGPPELCTEQQMNLIAFKIFTLH